jgi:hypothetical protein
LNCSHPNLLRDANGVLRCLTCKQAVTETEPPTVNASGRKIGFEAEAEKPKRTRKKKAEA